MANPCGCVEDELGLPVLTCAKHDKRTARVKVAAALMQMGSSLDEAGKALESEENRAGSDLRDAARFAIKAAQALVGTEE